MRPLRLTRPECLNFFHCISRVVDKQFIFRSAEKLFFYQWMRRLEDFTGVEVVTYCLMSNHFHLLLRIPCKSAMPRLDAAELRRLLPLLYNAVPLKTAVQELDRAEQMASAGQTLWLEEILARYEARRFNLSSFLKDLKQRFAQWYNARNSRVGTLWEDRFKSVLVEGNEQALLTIAAYIDLNPVRAGLVDDPALYRWSGYGEAINGSGNLRTKARGGLGAILRHTNFGINRKVTWGNTAPRYRLLLYLQGEQVDPSETTGATGRPGLDRANVAHILNSGGEMSMAETLRCRIRYFCEGLAIGSKKFVNDVQAGMPHPQKSAPTASLEQADRKPSVPPPHPALHAGNRSLSILRRLRRNIAN